MTRSPNSVNLRQQPDLDHVLRKSVATYPDANLVVDEGGAFTALQFDSLVERICAQILETSNSGDRVAVALERSVLTAAAVFAVWRAGCTYVPVDTKWPSARIRAILESGADVALYDTDASLELEVVRLRDSLNDVTGAEDEDRPAYIIHTSGSTGQPKGVAVSHKALLRLVQSHQEIMYSDLRRDGGHIMVASPAFDSSIERLSLAAQGYTLHVVPESSRTDPGLLMEYVRRHQIRSIDLVPSHAKVLADFGLFSRDSGLEIIILGGEAVDGELWQRAGECEAAVYNVYGPTENTINTSIARVSSSHRPNIGTVLPGVSYRVVDASGMRVNRGETGELVVGGEQLAIGYIGREGSTSSAFFEDDEGRHYRTGDLVSEDPAGQLLYYRGRADEQVKVNGNRVELDDVLTNLKSLPGVRDAAVSIIDGKSGPRLLASIVSDSNGRESSYYRSCLERLVPTYMVPHHWNIIESIPLTLNMKRDHQALVRAFEATNAGTHSETEADYAENRSPTSLEARTVPRELLQLYREALGVDVVDLDENFFAIGGDSISAMRLVAGIRETFDVPVRLSNIIANPSVNEMATYLVGNARREKHGVADGSC